MCRALDAQGRSMLIPFTESDVCLLVAIAGSRSWLRRGASLYDIIYTGDYLNRRPFSAPELRRGMAKLIAAGYAREDRGRFALTPAGRKVVAWRGSTASLQAAAVVYARLERELSAARDLPNAPGFEDPDWPYPGISDEAVAQAQLRHSQSVARFMGRGKRRDGV